MSIFCLKRALVRHLRVTTVLMTLLILFGLFSMGAQPYAVGLFPSPWDKLAHAAVFSVLAAAIALASGMRGWRMILFGASGAILVGIMDEWHQVYLPGRQAGLDDLAADALGSMLGACILNAVKPATEQRTQKRY